jgi:nicotinic acid phosphoribosyltransferase
VIIMGDIRCKKCGEPWDAYGVRMALLRDEGDMSQDEARRFMNGDGCPCCKFGKRKRDTVDDMDWLMELADEELFDGS